LIKRFKEVKENANIDEIKKKQFKYHFNAFFDINWENISEETVENTLKTLQLLTQE